MHYFTETSLTEFEKFTGPTQSLSNITGFLVLLRCIFVITHQLSVTTNLLNMCNKKVTLRQLIGIENSEQQSL